MSGNPSTGMIYFMTVSHRVKVFILTIANGLFDLSLWVVLLYWASCVLPQVSDWKWPLGGAVEQAPEQSRGVEKVIYLFFFIVVLWLLLYNSVLNNVLFIHFRKVEQGLEKGVSLNSASVAQSSQYHLIQSKPDYHSLCRQQSLLQAMEIIVSWKCDQF